MDEHTSIEAPFDTIKLRSKTLVGQTVDIAATMNKAERPTQYE